MALSLPRMKANDTHMIRKHHAEGDEKKGFLSWLRKSAQKPADTVVFLPRLICCMEQMLYINLSDAFICLRNTKTECIFRHKQNGLRLCVSVMQSDLPIHRLTTEEICNALGKRLIPSCRTDDCHLQVCEQLRGFVKHSPTLQVHFIIGSGTNAEEHALYLLQWNHKLYAAAFSNITEQNAPLIAPICASISLRHHHPEQANP